MQRYLNTLTTADCLKSQGLCNLPDQCIDLVLADLPFGTTRNPWDSVLDLDKLWPEYERLIKPTGAIVLYAQAPFDKVLGASNMPLFRYQWIWEKTSATGHLNAKKAPMKAHEMLLVFYKKRGTFNPQKTSGHPRIRVSAIASNKARPSSNYDVKYLGNRKEDYNSTERYPRDVLRFAKDKQRSKLHPTQKPVALNEYVIRTYTNFGDVVLDNTIGSGSTAIAAINTGRNWIGFEKIPAVADDANQRIIAHYADLDGGRQDRPEFKSLGQLRPKISVPTLIL